MSGLVKLVTALIAGIVAAELFRTQGAHDRA